MKKLPKYNLHKIMYRRHWTYGMQRQTKKESNISQLTEFKTNFS